MFLRPLAYFLIVSFLGPASCFAQAVDPEFDIDFQVQKDIEVIQKREVVAPKKPSAPVPAVVKVSTDADAPLVIDEEALYATLTHQWHTTRRQLRDFRESHRPACEQNTDLKGNEWHFLRRISDYITFQTNRIRDTYAASENLETFAQTKFQLMMGGQESQGSLGGQASPNKLQNDFATAAVNVFLADMVLHSQVDHIKSQGLWHIAGVPIPKRMALSLVGDNLQVFLWYKWARLAHKLPGMQRFLGKKSGNLVVRLSRKRLPFVCQSRSTIAACIKVLRGTQAFIQKSKQVIVFQGGAIPAGLALWSDVWDQAISLSSWFYIRLPRWKARLEEAVKNYEVEIQDLCYYRQCYEVRMQRRVAEGRERREAKLIFEDPSHEHFQMKKYCSSFPQKRGDR